MPTGDIVILGIVIAVFLAVTIFGGAVLWHTVKPGPMDTEGWTKFAAIGTWFAGTSTFGAVVVALLEGRRARLLADENLRAEERRHRELLHEEQTRSDLTLATGLIPDLEKFAQSMRSADTKFQGYSMYRSLQRKKASESQRDGDEAKAEEPTDVFRFDTFKEYDAVREPCRHIRTRFQEVGLALRVPSAVTAISRALEIVDRIEQQIFSWSMQVATGNDPQKSPNKLKDFALDENWSEFGRLYAGARLAQEVIINAVSEVQTRNSTWDESGPGDGR